MKSKGKGKKSMHIYYFQDYFIIVKFFFTYSYRTPLFNGFGLDIDSAHMLNEQIDNVGVNKEAEGCEYSSDASEGADDTYYALIPKVEVSEDGSSDSIMDLLETRAADGENANHDDDAEIESM